MDIGIIAMIVLLLLGALMFFAPKQCTGADRQDDPEAVAKVKKMGGILMLGAVFAGLYVLKVTLW